MYSIIIRHLHLQKVAIHHLPADLLSPLGFSFIPKVKELCAKADKLKLSHPSDADQIQQMKEDLVSNWEHIRTLATRRYEKLQASYWWEILLLYCIPYLYRVQV